MNESKVSKSKFWTLWLDLDLLDMVKLERIISRIEFRKYKDSEFRLDSFKQEILSFLVNSISTSLEFEVFKFHLFVFLKL